MAGSDEGHDPAPTDPRRESTTSLAGSDDFQDAEPGTPASETTRPDTGAQEATGDDTSGAAHSAGGDAPAPSSSPHVAPSAAVASTSSLHLPLKDPHPSLDPEASSPDELVALLRGQITDLAGQVTSLNSKLVKSYTTRGELEDDLLDTQESVRSLRQRITQLEQDKAKWDKEIEAGGWVEKNHVQGEMQRLMTKVVEETKSRESAVQAHSALETEIENLTSNLFTEANKMVAFERVARARAEEKTRSVEEAGVSMQALLEEVQVGLRDTVTKLEKRDAEVAELKKRLAAHGEAVEEDAGEDREGADGDIGGIMFSDGEHLSPLDTKALATSSAQPSTSHLSAPRLLTSVLPYHEFLAFITYLRQTRVTALSRPPEAGYSHPALTARAFAADPPPSSHLTPAQLLAPHLLLSTHLSQPFLKRCVEEDSDPALRLDIAPGLGFLSRRGVGSAIVDGTLLIEPLHAGIDLQTDKCALCGCSLEKWLPNSGIVRGFKQPTPTVTSVNQKMRKLGSSLFSRSTSSGDTPTLSSATSTSSSYHHPSSSTESFVFPPPAASASHHPHDALLLVHLFRTSDTASQRYPVCPSYCLARLRAVCEFWTYIRVIERGLLLEEGFRFGQSGRADGAADRSEPQTPVRSAPPKPLVAGDAGTGTGTGTDTARDGLGLGPVGAQDDAGEASVQAKDFEAEDTHEGGASEKGTPRIVEPEEAGEDKEAEQEQDGEKQVGQEQEQGGEHEGSPSALTTNSNGSSSSLSAAKPPRPSRSSARNSPVVSAPSSPRTASAPALPPRREGAAAAAPPPKHPSLAPVVPGGDIIATATGWEDRCWSEVVRLKESVFWARVAAVAPDGGEVSGRVLDLCVLLRREANARTDLLPLIADGHVRTLAEAIAEEAKTHGAEVDLLQIPEILSEEIRGKMHAAPRAEVPDVAPADLTKYDGFLFGFPTRYGRAPAAVSAFFDATGGLWAQGALVGKFAGVFTSSASQHGGQETTALTTVPFFAHHGILFVPIGFAAPELTDNSEVVGGSAYGAAGVANGDGSRQISTKELAIARYQAKFFTTTLAQFVAGKAVLEKQAVAPKEDTAVAAASTSEPAVVSGEPVLAKAVPATEAAPYAVDETAAAPVEAKEPTPAAAPTAAAAEPTPAPAAVPAPAAAAEKPAAPAAAPKSEAVKPKKKAGLFASCCGGSAKNYD
ncbi:hypothetical protein JCM10450v2_004403 [Rhodotorula kratochvilovae]